MGRSMVEDKKENVIKLQYMKCCVGQWKAFVVAAFSLTVPLSLPGLDLAVPSRGAVVSISDHDRSRRAHDFLRR